MAEEAAAGEEEEAAAAAAAAAVEGEGGESLASRIARRQAEVSRAPPASPAPSPPSATLRQLSSSLVAERPTAPPFLCQPAAACHALRRA